MAQEANDTAYPENTSEGSAQIALEAFDSMIDVLRVARDRIAQIAED